MAGAEFRAFVRTRSFVIGLALPPILVGIAGLTAWLTRPDPEPGPQPARIAVLDRTGSLFGALELAAARRAAAPGWRGLRLMLERVEPYARSDGERLAELHDRVQRGELQALVEIPADAAPGSAEPVRLRVVAHEAAGGELAGWLESVVREELRTRAVRSSGLPAGLRARLERQVAADVHPPAPLAGEASGLAPDPRAAPRPLRRVLEQLGPYQKLAIAGPLAFILFMVVSLSTAPLFQAVLEEKTSRVSEILLSSVSPFELMLGKLLGSLAACGIAAFAYAGLVVGGLVLGLGAALPATLLALFAAYLVLSLLLWGALFLAIGAACADMKDAQNLMLPVVLVQVLPVLLVGTVMGEPGGGVARLLSILPPTAPLVMLLRLGYDPAPQSADIVLSLALLAASALASLWAAGRVLRVGLLVQGRSATLREIVRWVRAG